MQDACFLTWIEHRRTRELCRRLDLELVELISEKRGLRRYLELVPKTITFLRRRRPSALAVQTPSIVLSVLALLARPWLGFRLVLDAHNEAIEPYLHRAWPARAVTYWLIRAANRVIVSNRQLAEIVKQRQGIPIVLMDPLPSPPETTRTRLSSRYSAVVISTFAGDEPIDAIFAAARIAGDDFQFFVTGNADKLPVAVRQKMPPNTTLTGYLADADYWSLLASVDVVIDLTTMDNCLVCGAYEAIAVGKPLVLSNNAASISAFAGFAEFTDNRPHDIAAAIMRVRDRHESLQAAIPGLRTEFDARWTAQSRLLRDFLASELHNAA